MRRIQLLSAILAWLMVCCPVLADAVSKPASVSQMLAGVRSQAIHEVLLAFHSDNAVMRTNALEAIEPIRDRARPLAEIGLGDKSVPVRFAALMTVGKLQLKSLADQAKAMIHDKNPSIRAAAIFAAHQCGLNVSIAPLAGLFASPDPTVRGNTALVLGQMGNRSAVAMIQDLAQQPMPRASESRQAVVQLQVAQVLLNLGDEKALDVLRAGAYSPYDEVRILAVQMLGKAQDHRMAAAFQQMIHQNPIQLQVAAAEALARMGDRSGQPEVLKAASMTAQDAGDDTNAQASAGSDAAGVRAQAAFALGVLRTHASISKLINLLSDDAASVRLAAAAAIIQAEKRTASD